MAEHVVKWLSPAPLWQKRPLPERTLSVPAILRFDSDTFMEDLFALLARDPGQISDLLVQHETWRKPMRGAAALAEPIALERKPSRALKFMRAVAAKKLHAGSTPASGTSDTYRLKLYQPAHQRHYLVTSSLVCAKTGFPDRAVNTGQQERVSFVLRRLWPKQDDFHEDLPAMDPDKLADWDEYAFVVNPTGNTWQKVTRPAAERVAGEEPLAMFPLAFEGALGERRRLLGGVVPAAKREAYLGAPAAGAPGVPADTGDRLDDPRLQFFLNQVVYPWRALVEANIAASSLTTPFRNPPFQETPKDGNGDEITLPDPEDFRKTRESQQTASWYILLDFAELLDEHIPGFLPALIAGNAPSGPELPLYNALRGLKLSANAVSALSDTHTGRTAVTELWSALASIQQSGVKDALENPTANYDSKKPYDSTQTEPQWPQFSFTFADVKTGPLLPVDDAHLHPPKDVDEQGNLTEHPDQLQLRQVEELGRLIARALPALPDEPQPAVSAAAKRGVDPRDGWFLIRCVYERPECGVLHDPIVSDPTPPFQLAGFFDPDAPARPIRIGLPFDPSPAGLRKFDRKTFVMISNVLCGHIDRVKSITLADIVLSVLPWPFHKDFTVKANPGPCKAGPDLGMMCTLSLPIITICALILLIIMVSLLDMFFHWMPFFIACFPLPGFKRPKTPIPGAP